ncbi:MAG: RNA methyltransferase [Bacilli bacterium]|nr:RNA methyltransferase [Bacilli bacterium]
MLEILSKNNQKIKDAYALRMKKVRQEKGLFLMEGIKNLDMALKYGIVKQIFTSIGLPKLNQNIECYKVNDEILRKLANSENPEGVVFVCEQLKPRKEKETYRKIVYLDSINDPGNLGTILRTAVAFNYDAVILSKSSVDIYNEKVVAASKGALFLVDAYYDDIDNYLEGRQLIVSALDDAVPLSECPKESDFVLVLGNESHGVSPEIIKKANRVVKIEMNDAIDSLNVAVAAGILMNYYK